MHGFNSDQEKGPMFPPALHCLFVKDDVSSLALRVPPEPPVLHAEARR